MTQFAPRVDLDNQIIHVDVHFSQDAHFKANFGVVQEITKFETEPYKGDYKVTPTVDGQVLPTAQKLMLDDLTVKGIPYFETSNLSDGETVYIGTEVDIYGD